MKLKEKLCDFLIVGTVMLLFLITAPSTFAGPDGKNYPGMMGIPFNYNDHVPNGMLENRSKEEKMHAELPIIHDKMRSQLRTIIVRCVDRNPSSDVYAKVTSRAQYGSFLRVFSTAYKFTNGASDYTHGLTFRNIDLWKDLRQFYYATVIIPEAVDVAGLPSKGFSGIASYYAVER